MSHDSGQLILVLRELDKRAGDIDAASRCDQGACLRHLDYKCADVEFPQGGGCCEPFRYAVQSWIIPGKDTQVEERRFGNRVAEIHFLPGRENVVLIVGLRWKRNKTGPGRSGVGSQADCGDERAKQDRDSTHL